MENQKNLLKAHKRMLNVKFGTFIKIFCLGSFLFGWGLTQFGRTLYFALLQWELEESVIVCKTA